MKYFVYTLIVFAIALLVFNSTQLDFEVLFTSTNKLPFIGILSGICVLLISAISLTSEKIATLANKNRK